MRRWPDLFATCLATVFFWASVTPSLVPRPWWWQAVVGGITGAIGYALGAIAAALFRAVVRKGPMPRLRAHCWQAYLVVGPIGSVLLTAWSSRAQQQLRELQHAEPAHAWDSPVIVLLAAAFCAVALLLARLVRLGTRQLIRWLDRAMPRQVAVAAGFTVSAVVVALAVQNVVFERGVVDVVDSIARDADIGTKEGITRPDTPLLAGGPGSLISWDDLGRQGRTFSGSAPRPAEIEAALGGSARQPIRAYASPGGPEAFSEKGYDAAAEARLAVRELERTHAFDRKVLLIAGTTGSGGVDAQLVEPVEFMYRGDTATVAMRYSYLPSWMSFLVDRGRAKEATEALVRAVQARLDGLPPDRRPMLLVTGESLGAFAVESSFGTPDRLLLKTDGAVLVGAPEFSPVARALRNGRDAGSPVWRPVYRDGRNFRFAQFPERDLDRPPGSWARPRVVELQNASDPVVWWSTNLLWREPAWMRKPLGPDIAPDVAWFPVVTFWQVSVDMALSFGVPAPHGHRYGTGAVTAWVRVAPPPGWTAEDTAALRRVAEHREELR